MIEGAPENDMIDPVVQVTSAPPPPPADPPRAKARPSEVLKQAEREEDIDIITWFKGVGGDNIGDIRVQIYRAMPEKMNVKWPDGRIRELFIKGHNITYDELVDEERITADLGGGVFDMKVMKRDDKGRYVHWRGKRVPIGGNPKPDVFLERDTEWINASAAARAPAAPAASNEQTPLAQQALTTVTNLLKEKNEKKDSSATDVQEIIRIAQSPLLDTIRELRADMKEVQNRPAAPVADPMNSPLVNKLVDGRDNTVNALRTQFESERNQINTYWMGQVARAEDAAARQIKSVEDAAAREVKALERAHETASSSIKLSYESRIDGLKDQIKRLERDLDNISKEIVALRASKTQTLTEKIEEIDALSEHFNKDDDKPSTLGQVAEVISALGNTPLGQGMAHRLAHGAGGAPAQQQPPQQQDPFAQVPVNTVFRYEGRVLMKLADGRVVPAKPRPKAGSKSTATGPGPQAGGAPGAAPAAAEEPLPKIDPADLAKAVSYIEGAIDSRTTPEQFAATAKIPGMIPAGIIGALRRGGLDLFLKMVDGDSVIHSIRGKEWTGKVVTILIQ